MNNFLKRALSSIILLPLSIYLISAGSIYLLFFTSICFFVSIYEWNNMVKKIELKCLGILFLIFSFYTFYNLSTNIFWIFVLFVCVCTDVGGYIFGKLFKGPKLTKISPNKTYSGMIGGFLLSLIFLSYFIDSIYLSAHVSIE